MCKVMRLLNKLTMQPKERSLNQEKRLLRHKTSLLRNTLIHFMTLAKSN